MAPHIPTGMAAVTTPRAPIRSKREHENTSFIATPSSKSPKSKQLRTSETESSGNSNLIPQRSNDMENAIMASVTAALTDFKVKIELQLKEEMKKLEDSLVAKITKEVDDKLKEVREEFNQSTTFIETSLQDEIANVREHAIHNEQYSRKNSVRISGITEDEGEDVEQKVIDFMKTNLKVDISRSEIEISHRVGRQHQDANGRQWPRQVIVKFESHKVKEKTMRAKSLLKGTNYSLQEDLTPAIYKRLKELKKCFRVDKCCSVDGKVKYKLKNDENVRMIHNDLDLKNVINGR